MDCNDYYLQLSSARNNEKRQRLKGWYVCFDCGEYIKAIAKQETHCPFCKKLNKLQLVINSVQEQMIHAVWKDCGTYSEVRADIRKG